MFTVTFDGYDVQSEIDAWANWAVTSTWLTQVGADYGITAGTNTSIHLNEVAGAVVLDSTLMGPDPFQQWMEAHFNSGLFPRPTAQSLYMVYFPGATRIEATGEGASCDGFGAYHSSYYSQALGGILVAYAVIPECDTASAPTSVELAASHELIEAATDPFVQSGATAWEMPGNVSSFAADLWSAGEVGDLCVPEIPEAWTDPSGRFSAQRIWSNTAAAGPGSPCIPAPAGEAFASATALPIDGGMIAVSLVGGFPAQRYALPAGATVSLVLQPWATTSDPSWTLNLVQGKAYPTTDNAVIATAPAVVALAVTPSSLTVTNGVPATVSVTMPVDVASQTVVYLDLVPEFGSSRSADSAPYPLVFEVP